MVLKFKVWRLDWEKRSFKLKGKKHFHWRLVLRDKSGRIYRVAKNAYEEAKLQRRYEKYNEGAKLEQLLAVRRLKEHVRKVKAEVRRRGFRKQLSCYGIFADPKTKKRFYCRYEIFRHDAWTQQDVAGIHDFLKSHRPKSAAGVFIFHGNRLYVVAKDEVTQFGVERLGYKGERRNLDVD
jgi:hypothetical protein